MWHYNIIHSFILKWIQTLPYNSNPNAFLKEILEGFWTAGRRSWFFLYCENNPFGKTLEFSFNCDPFVPSSGNAPAVGGPQVSISLRSGVGLPHLQYSTHPHGPLSSAHWSHMNSPSWVSLHAKGRHTTVTHRSLQDKEGYLCTGGSEMWWCWFY